MKRIFTLTAAVAFSLTACGASKPAEVAAPAAATTPAPTTTQAPAPTTVPETTVAETVPTIAPVTTVAVVIPLTVTKVVDGDTLDLSDGSTVRLIGIDTPERGQCGYDEATAVLSGLVSGFDVTLVPGARDDVDKYGRILRYVEVNGVDANLSMIESGRAIARYDGRDGYGVHTRQDAYVAADEASPSLNVCEPAPAPVTTAAPAPEPAPAPTAAPVSVSYKNCAAVRAAGAAPIHAGDPGWSSKFDKDGDGVGCE